MADEPWYTCCICNHLCHNLEITECDNCERKMCSDCIVQKDFPGCSKNCGSTACFLCIKAGRQFICDQCFYTSAEYHEHCKRGKDVMPCFDMDRL